jgi:hypothetical protein
VPILNYTTKVAAETTAGQIQKILVGIGAQAIMTEYDDEGVMCALSFSMHHNGLPIMFRLPARIDAIHSMLQETTRGAAMRSRDHAARVAWRIIKDWVEAQAAIIEAEQADMIEVFLPYAQDASGTTVYERLKKSDFQLLEYKP